MQPHDDDPRQDTENAPDDQSEHGSGKTGKASEKKRRRRRRRPAGDTGLERIAEVHYCRTDEEANQYLALGAEWDLQDIIPMRVETEDGGERDEVHFVVARWETDRDRERLRQRDRHFSVRKKND